MPKAKTDKRLRVSFDAESELVRRAIYIAAAAKGVTHNELLNGLVKGNLGDYLAFARTELENEKRTAGQ